METIRPKPSGQSLVTPPAASAADSGRQMTLWPVAGDGTDRRIQRPRWHRTSPLSREAAKQAEPRAGTRKAAVLAYCRGRGRHGATREEISCDLQIPIQSVCGPVRALLDGELLCETAETRTTRQGSAAAVMIAVELEETR